MKKKNPKPDEALNEEIVKNIISNNMLIDKDNIENSLDALSSSKKF